MKLPLKENLLEVGRYSFESKETLIEVKHPEKGVVEVFVFGDFRDYRDWFIVPHAISPAFLDKLNAERVLVTLNKPSPESKEVSIIVNGTKHTCIHNADPEDSIKLVAKLEKNREGAWEMELLNEGYKSLKVFSEKFLKRLP